VLAEHAGRQAPIPTHGDEDLSPVFIKKICKQLRIDPNEIL
jgi:predicted RNA binding protein YcfA (HicA-like mRNA interferase family)